MAMIIVINELCGIRFIAQERKRLLTTVLRSFESDCVSTMIRRDPQIILVVI